MKRKGITIWEQHVEHIVLAAAVLFFVVFAALQFISEPNQVDMQGGKKVDPGDIDALLEDTATDLQARLTPDAPPSFRIPDHEPVVEIFAEQIASPVAERPIVASHRSVVLVEEIGPGGTDVAYVVPEVEAPYSVVADQYFDAVLTEEVDAHEKLQEILPDAPHDLTWVTAAAQFSLEQVWEQLRRTGPEDARPLPINWYDDRITILDVRVEREEKVDGHWTNRQTLDILPGQVSVRAQIGDTPDRTVRDDVLGRLSDEGEQIALIRPPFMGTVNDAWTPPDPREDRGDVAQGLTEEQQKIIDLTRQIKNAVARRDKLAKQYEDLGGALQDLKPPKEEEPEERERPGRGGDREDQGRGGDGGKDRRAPPKEKKAPPGGGAAPGMNTGGGSGTGDTQRNKRLLDRLKAQILRQDQLIARRSRTLQQLGGDAQGVLADAQDANPGDMSADDIVVWAHDITIEPNRTYRYRFTVDLYNPFFAHRIDLLEDQHDLAESITMSSAPSAWSDELRAIPPLKVYVTKADSEQGSLDLGQATAEVFRFYYGRWWRREFPVQPGDRVGSIRLRRDAESDPASVDYGTDWFVLDIIPDPDAGKEARDRGLAAAVLLQHRSDPGRTILLDPRQVALDPERARLRDLVDQASIPDEVASAGP
ncbi:MAG: hypothetical protein ACYTGP_09735 [Planctomycetota bacterium]|jgi:hypothetical protein